MTIYAIFICLKATGLCNRLQPGFTSGYSEMPAIVYRSAPECVAAMERLAGYRYWATPEDVKHLRIRVGAPGSGIRYECLGRHVNTWEER